MKFIDNDGFYRTLDFSHKMTDDVADFGSYKSIVCAACAFVNGFLTSICDCLV